MTKNPRKDPMNKIMVNMMVENLEKLLVDGKASHYIVVDKNTSHEEIVIKYNKQKR